MGQALNTQKLSRIDAPELTTWVRSFLSAKRSEGLASGTIDRAYAPPLIEFVAYSVQQGIRQMDAIDPSLIRDYLMRVADGHKPSTVHRNFRVLRTWLRWYEVEAAPDGWRNPIKRVGAPRVPEIALDPANLEDLSAMTRHASVRDKAMLYTLVDTGIRAAELLALNIEDFDQADGVLTIRRGKGGKVRLVPVGPRTRRALRQWLRSRKHGGRELFPARDGGRLTYQGLRNVLMRISKRAGVKTPMPHSIRRAFAIGMLRAGIDLLTLSRLMGHSGLHLLAKYAKQNTADLKAAIERASLADRL